METTGKSRNGSDDEWELDAPTKDKKITATASASMFGTQRGSLGETASKALDSKTQTKQPQTQKVGKNKALELSMHELELS